MAAIAYIIYDLYTFCSWKLIHRCRHIFDIAMWLRDRNILLQVPSWPSGDTQTTHLQYYYCNCVDTSQLTHLYKCCME